MPGTFATSQAGGGTPTSAAESTAILQQTGQLSTSKGIVGAGKVGLPGGVSPGAVTPAPVKPVTALSTKSGIDTVTGGLTKLNAISPGTNPDAPPAPPNPDTKTNNGSSTEKTDNSGAPEKTNPAPTASFANENGQEAEYTQDQLNDPAIQSFIKNGGYQMTKTTGPSLSAPTDQGSSLQTDINAADAKISAIADQFNSYVVDNDPAFQTIAQNINTSFGALSTAMKQANDSRVAAATTLGYRNGSAQYTPGIALGLVGAELTAGNMRLADIASKEADAITSARSAYQSGKFAEFNDQINALSKVRDDKVTELKDYNSNITTIVKNYQAVQQRADEDNAISTLFSAGTTDPAEILSKMNAAGYKDLTAKDVSDTLASFAGTQANGDLKALTGNVKDFYVLQANGTLPSSISSLPPDQQLKAFLDYIKPATVRGLGSSGASGAKFTVASAKAAGLPQSVVGMTEGDITASFSSSTPPDWFQEKLNTENGASVDSAKTAESWTKYRAAYSASFNTKTTSNSSSPTPNPADAAIKSGETASTTSSGRTR